MEKGILIAYGELFLKSEGVRKLFQKRLVNNLRFFLEKANISFKIHSSRERIFIAVSVSARPCLAGRRAVGGGRQETKQTKKTSKIIKKIFGIAWMAESFFFPKINLKEFSDFIDKNYPDWIKKSETFAIRLRLEKGILRENKENIIDKIAKNIKRKVDLTKPKREIFIEIRRNGWFLYLKKGKGAGGMPVGSGGKVLSLVSGGIDSPIASYLIAKRGAENIWLHFHSFPLVSNASIEKVKEMANIFLNYQPHLKIYFVPFQKAQVEIKTKTPTKYRILLYRRLMLKIAERIAKKENCQALVTGESLGQVSSQTLPNIKITGQSVKVTILRPLVGLDKEEIIELAREIGFFEISIRPQEDCCTLFVPKHQTAEGKIEAIEEIEKQLNSTKIIREIVKEIKIECF